jgi:RNA methyltransferase, TrmH family
MKAITSTDNPIYKSIKDLTTARGRHEQGLFIAESPHLVEEALKAGAAVRYAVVSEDASERCSPLLQAFQDGGAELLSMSARLFKQLSDTEAPQGILAVVARKQVAPDELELNKSKVAVILERIQDPGNLGTILRTALAVGAGFAVLSADCADAWSQKVVRASQGAVLHLPIVEADNIAETITALNGKGWHTACGHLSGSDFFARAAHARTALVIGNEASGVSAEAAAACCALYKLPMPGPAESLNAAVAAGIMLYDIWREQNRT